MAVCNTRLRSLEDLNQLEKLNRQMDYSRIDGDVTLVKRLASVPNKPDSLSPVSQP